MTVISIARKKEIVKTKRSVIFIKKHPTKCVKGRKDKEIYSSDCKAICSTIFNFPKHKIDSTPSE